MATGSREELHRAVEQLPDDRLAAAADLLDALAIHDARVAEWRVRLTPAEVSQIAADLRRAYPADEWLADEAVESWMASVSNGDGPPSSRSRS